MDRFMGGTMGIGLSENVQAGYDFLAANYSIGDRIYLFGFSRGAYTVRSLAGLISQTAGLLKKADMDLFPYVFNIYQDRDNRGALATKDEDAIEKAALAVHSKKTLRGNLPRLVNALSTARPVSIFFVGVWETVGAMGIPGGGLRKIGQAKYNFHDTKLNELIRHAYQALAIDERRDIFEPALWTRPKGRGADTDDPQILEQVWFSGVHSNVGGGYLDNGLSDNAFLWMVDKAREAKEFREGGDKHLPLEFDDGYLGSLNREMGGLGDSSGRGWRWLGLSDRKIMAEPPRDHETGKEQETCEAIHWSAQYRLNNIDGTRSSFPTYDPKNLRDALSANKDAVTTLSAFERRWKYGDWPGA